MDLLPIQLRPNLAPHQVERIQQRLSEVVKDARQLLPREELGREVAEKPRITLTALGTFAFVQDPRDQEPDDERYQQQHDSRHHVLHRRDAEREPRGGEEEDEPEERQRRREQATPEAPHRCGEDDREQVEGDRRNPARAIDREREQGRRRREADPHGRDPGRRGRPHRMEQLLHAHRVTLARSRDLHAFGSVLHASFTPYRRP